jgi:vacuolar-type H+-ATPase subunit F/Vma7
VKVVVVGSPDEVRGFALAGVEGQTATTRREAIDALRDLLGAGQGVGLLLLSQAVAQAIPREIRELRLRGAPPALLILPGSGEARS